MVRKHLIPVVGPFRLDLTVSALRRLPTNIVDLLTPEGDYLRALSGPPQPLIVRVSQTPDNGSLSITIDGHGADEPQTLRLLQKILGTEKDISDFDKRSAHIPWLAPLVRRMRGVKPPCYPTLWEACVNAIVFQQLSIRAASAIIRRLIMALGQRVERDSLPLPLYVFPAAERFQEASEDTLRATGLSASKAGTLRRVAERLMSGTLESKELEEVSSGDAMAALCRIKGILLDGSDHPASWHGPARCVSRERQQRPEQYDARGGVGIPGCPPGIGCPRPTARNVVLLFAPRPP